MTTDPITLRLTYLISLVAFFLSFPLLLLGLERFPSLDPAISLALARILSEVEVAELYQTAKIKDLYLSVINAQTYYILTGFN